MCTFVAHPNRIKYSAQKPPAQSFGAVMRGIVGLISLLYVTVAVGTADDSVAKPKAPIPESGFISLHQYTNAFFGFALSIPSSCRFQISDPTEPAKPLEHFLIGENCAAKGLSSFGISATPVLRSGDDEAQKAVLLPTMGPKAAPVPINVAGQAFWKNTIEEKTLWGQKVWRARYATVSKGFVLLFWISSYNPRLVADLRQAIETIRFFDPVRALEMAGTDSHPYLPEAARRIQSSSDLDLPELDAGELHGNIYVNQSLGFSYKFPDGWVRSTKSPLQTKTQNSDSEALFFGSESKATPGQCARLLASFTNRDEQNRQFDSNSRITIMAAKPSCFISDIQFPTSLDDSESVKTYNQALTDSLVGTRLVGREQIKFFGINLNDHIFLEIASSNAEPVAGNGLLRKIHSDLILTTAQHAWIIWLFESDAEGEFAKILTSSISFDSPEDLPH